MAIGCSDYTSVLIVSDDAQFSRSVVAHWQGEFRVPEITLITSDVWRSGSADGYHLVILGPVRHATRSSILSTLSDSTSAVICITDDQEENLRSLRTTYSFVLFMVRQNGWIEALVLVASEALRRIEAARRAQRAERLAVESQGQAILGRYMMEMRPSVNNALTSVLGNADLLLLEPGQISAETREQIQTIHAMALRLNEIMYRFSSLAVEVRASEKHSQGETEQSHQRRFVSSPVPDDSR